MPIESSLPRVELVDRSTCHWTHLSGLGRLVGWLVGWLARSRGSPWWWELSLLVGAPRDRGPAPSGSRSSLERHSTTWSESPRGALIIQPGATFFGVPPPERRQAPGADHQRPTGPAPLRPESRWIQVSKHVQLQRRRYEP